ncbi:hypothetical protein, partial [Acinetobacter haemolyticus]|uniref:hypothetical protein n=1 Tax=Acinetobacter haemolyticus TaxID=29430 RepID=UPI002006FB7F
KQDQLEDEFGEFTPVNYALDVNDINGKVLDNSNEFNLLQQATSALRSIDVWDKLLKIDIHQFLLESYKKFLVQLIILD